jgi:hypothetical protein
MRWLFAKEPESVRAARGVSSAKAVGLRNQKLSSLTMAGWRYSEVLACEQEN